MIKRSLVVGAFYCVLTVILTWPLLPNSGTHAINAGDPLFYAWNLMHNVTAASLDTNIYYPTTNTLAFSDTLAAQTIFTAPIILITNNPLLAVNLYTILTFPVAGLGMYLLVRSLTKNEIASVLSGAVFAFSYPRLGQLAHVPALSSQWLPFFLYGLYWQKALISLLSFLLLLGSSVYLGAFALVIAIIMFAFKPSGILKYGRKAILPLLVTAALSLLLMYPYIRLKAEHPEITRSLAEASTRAAYQEDYASVTNTSILAGLFKTNEGERTLYPTITALSLAAVGLSRSSPSLLFAAVTLTGLILSFGPERPFSLGPVDTGYITLPYAYLYKIFPLLQILRVPARFSIMVMVGLSVLAGLGAARLKKPALIVLTVLFFIEIWQRPMPLVKVPTYRELPLVYRWLREQSNVRAIVELPIQRIEYGAVPIQQQVGLAYDQINEDAPLVTETYRAYFAGFHGKNTVNGYSGYVAQSYHDAVGALASFPDELSIKYLRDLGVTHVIVHPWQARGQDRNRYILPPNHPSLKTTFATLDGDIVYEIR